MEKHFLKSMTDYVLEQDITLSDSKFKIVNYANFLKQQPILGHFVPCDLEGNILEEPAYDPSNEQYWSSYFHEYQQAKERVLFNGFTISGDYLILPSGSHQLINDLNVLEIEDLVKHNVELTDNAAKMLGYES